MWTLTHNLPTNTLRPKAQRKYSNTFLVKKKKGLCIGMAGLPFQKHEKIPTELQSSKLNTSYSKT